MLQFTDLHPHTHQSKQTFHFTTFQTNLSFCQMLLFTNDHVLNLSDTQRHVSGGEAHMMGTRRLSVKQRCESDLGMAVNSTSTGDEGVGVGAWASCSENTLSLNITGTSLQLTVKDIPPPK